MNHPNRKLMTARGQENYALLKAAFERCDGRARGRLNGAIPGFDETRGSGEVFIRHYTARTRYLPARRFAEIMTDAEAEALREMPRYNGTNGHEMTCVLLDVVKSVFDRECLTQRA